MDQTQPAGEGEQIGRSRSRSGSAARILSRSRSRSPPSAAAREPRDDAGHDQPAWLRAPTNGEIIATELTAAADPPLLRPDQADQKYEEASAEAVNACAEDTKGQTCWICFDDGSKEGLVRGCSCRGTAGFAHVSCLAEQAKILVAEAWENNLSDKVKNERWARWHTCGQCKQKYHGVVACALGWACWKTYVGRPETDRIRRSAMTQLGNGLQLGSRKEDALSVREADLSMRQRLGDTESNILAAQCNLASTYQDHGRLVGALWLKRDAYSGYLRLFGDEHLETLRTAYNYAVSLLKLECFTEARALLLETMPVARRVLGESHQLPLMMRWVYGKALYRNGCATLDDLRETVTTLEELAPTARRVLGGMHPIVVDIEEGLQGALAALGARNFFPPGARVS